MSNHENNIRSKTACSPSRRGILLLVVLSMLTLFLLIGTAFIVSSDQYRQAQKIQARLTETSNSSIDQENLLNEVLNQLVRDTHNQNSTLRFHSLLRDMYGNDGILAEMRIDTVEWATAVWGNGDNFTSGQMLQFQLNPTAVTNQFGINFDPSSVDRAASPLPNFPTLSRFDNAYNGLLLTFLDGPARGQSVRIVGYQAVAPGPTGNARAIFRVMSPRLANGSAITNPSVLNPTPTQVRRILINGRPFNGTGVGYAAAPGNAAKLTMAENFFGNAHMLSLTPNNSFQSLALDTDQPAPFSFVTGDVEVVRNTIDDNYHFTPLQALKPGEGGADPLNIHDGSLAAHLNAIRLKNLIGSAGLGGADESYDAVDFQNMMLGLLQPNPLRVETVLPDVTTSPLPVNLSTMPIPSLHRPALINYWWNLAGADLQSNPKLLRKVAMRPSWFDHPNFTGSNPDVASLVSTLSTALAANPDPTDGAVVDASNNLIRRSIFGPWDVDNDNDGVRDSVWVDFGAPVMENADGRLVKPLAAILVLDMDGRLNLNAHGSQDIAQAKVPGMSAMQPAPQRIAGNNNMSDILPHGVGFGPAEISLEPLMPGNTATDRWQWYRRVFQGVANSDRLIPQDGGSRVMTRRRMGKLGMGASGRDSDPGYQGFDTAAQLKMMGVPEYGNGQLPSNGNFAPLGGFATPPDYRGRYGLGLNEFGQPVYEALGNASFGYDPVTLNADTPYELDLSMDASRGDNPSAADGAYSMAELERVLRAFDPDAGALPSRIWEMAGEFKPNGAATTPDLGELNLWRTTVTTDSYDLPVPSVTVPEWMLSGPDATAGNADDFVEVMNQPAVGVSFADLLEYRLRVAQSPVWQKADDATNPTRLAALRLEIHRLLPADLANGLRLDINRPLGNGRDDNNNGVVDEPGENEGAFWVSNDARLDAFTGINGRYQDDALFLEADLNGDNVINNQDRDLREMELGITDAIDTLAERVTVHNLRRQTLARDMYVMALTLVDPLPPTATNNDTERRARQLAQWAINIVDYRDPDNIMTAFEYDENPFDGWSVDGNLATDEGSAAGREVVWGLERPELLVTETLAWHDRRTEDHVDEDTSKTGDEAASVEDSKDPDQDFDQRIPPLGAGFIELYNPWPANPAVNADTHAVDRSDPTDTKDLGVDLAAVDELTRNSPVWRVAVYRNAYTKTGNAGQVSPPQYLDPRVAVALDPDAPQLNQRPNMIDRSIYFCGFDPEVPERPTSLVDPSTPDPVRKWDEDGVAFFEGDSTQDMLALRASMPADQQNGPVVRPGRFMVIGSGEETSGVYESPIGELTLAAKPAGAPSPDPWRMVMRPNDPSNPIEFVVDPLSDPASSIAFAAPADPEAASARSMADIAVMNRAGDSKPASNGVPATPGTPNGEPRRFTFSEPVASTTSREYPPQLPAGHSYDVPFDNNREDDLNGELMRLDFAPGFRWVYLQRLANPLLPWNPEPITVGGVPANPLTHNPDLAVNPYITIDTSPVNLTVFNGRSDPKYRVKAGGTGQLGDEVINNQIFKNNDAYIGFASVERGQNNEIVRAERSLLGSGKAGGAKQNQFDNPWNVENPGYSRNGKPDGTQRHRFSRAPDATLGFLNSAFSESLPAGGTAVDVTPDQPFPWLTWNNRPFASDAELMHVPKVRSSQLLRTFSTITGAGSKEKYNGSAISTVTEREADGPFNHQPNFFRTSNTDTGGTPLSSANSGIAGLFRVLDYVHVPSPYVGTETWLNPVMFGDTTTPVENSNDPRYQLQPPFNRISSYREPGKVNLNTIMSADVWDGGILHRELITPGQPWHPVSNNYRTPNPTVGVSGHTGPLFQIGGSAENLAGSRRGYSPAVPSLLVLGSSSPTFFANPFRAPDAGNLVPLTSMVTDPVHCTALRSVNATNTGDPLFINESVLPFNNTNRNPYFRYQPMTRLSSMTTTRSNVYAVWVTIGFFEVEEAPDFETTFTALNDPAGSLPVNQLRALYDRVYPEGYALGQEAGSETGDIRRVREFAIVDRTVPVAFEPGENHNVDKAIRLRRRIE